MDRITKRSKNSTRFTVNRVYQPARFERELLAQVFGIVEHGDRKGFARGDAHHEPVVSAVNSESNGQFATAIVGVNNPIQIIELEEVA